MDKSSKTIVCSEQGWTKVEYSLDLAGKGSGIEKALAPSRGLTIQDYEHGSETIAARYLWNKLRSIPWTAETIDISCMNRNTGVFYDFEQ